MNIMVCIKQVPDTSEIEVDFNTGVLKRGEAGSQINPYDLYALETALRIKESKGGKISVITLGEIEARQIIRESYMMGADEGFLVSDKGFNGSDVYATASILSQAISKKAKPDIIILGKKSTDSGTAHLGSELAELLGISNVSNVTKILEINENSLSVEIDLEDSTVKAKIKLPCLLSVDENINEPRLLSFRRKLKTEKTEISLLTLKDLELEGKGNYGLNGSPTHIEKMFPAKDLSYENSEVKVKEGSTEVDTLQIKRIFPQAANDTMEVWTGASRELSKAIYKRLKELKHV